MDTILDALQEGRLFELPENDKQHSLQFLAHIIEAFPHIPPGIDIVGNILNREKATNTALGKGWACPHARADFEEDLMCVVGWSPTGIEYGAPDSKKVSIIIMYFVPANQRNHFLREISIITKILISAPEITKIDSITNLNGVRNYLLDLISGTKGTEGSDTRAKMIKLQAKSTLPTQPIGDLSSLIIEPLTIIVTPGLKATVLTQNADLLSLFQETDEIAKQIEVEGSYQNSIWRIMLRHTITYQGNNLLYECIAVSDTRTVSIKK